MIKVLFAAGNTRWAQFESHLGQAFLAQDLEVDLAQDHAPEETDFIVYAPNKDFANFSPFVNVKLVQSLWAGVEGIVTNKTLTQPLARMVDEGLTEGMVEWVTGHVLRHHLGMDSHIVNPKHEWIFSPAPLARSRTVGVLGLGELGAACANALAQLNFNVVGWSRRPKSLDGIRCLDGDTGLGTTLQISDILVLLLPLTHETKNVIDASGMAQMPKGAVIINPGRGPLIDDDALLSALESGQISHATLDVFRTEPLPKDHPFWPHPKITVTPHIASETRAETASLIVAENIRRVENGERARYLVDRTAGY